MQLLGSQNDMATIRLIGDSGACHFPARLAIPDVIMVLWLVYFGYLILIICFNGYCLKEAVIIGAIMSGWNIWLSIPNQCARRPSPISVASTKTGLRAVKMAAHPSARALNASASFLV